MQFEIFKSMPKYHREHIFCDNASTDKTLAILCEIAARDPRVKVIGNARNCGPMRNPYNGVMASSGEAVLLFLPADLRIHQSFCQNLLSSGHRATRSSTGSGPSARKDGLCGSPAASTIAC